MGRWAEGAPESGAWVPGQQGQEGLRPGGGRAASWLPCEWWKYLIPSPEKMLGPGLSCFLVGQPRSRKVLRSWGWGPPSGGILCWESWPISWSGGVSQQIPTTQQMWPLPWSGDSCPREKGP